MTHFAERARAALEAYESTDRDAMTDSDLLREHGLTIREALELAANGTAEAMPLLRAVVQTWDGPCETRSDANNFLSAVAAARAYLAIPTALAVKAAQYKEANPLGGPASMFRTIAERIEAGEPYHDVLQDYGVSVNVPDQERDEVTAFYSDAARAPVVSDGWRELGERACALYCRWYDTGEPRISGESMAFELASFIRLMLAAAPKPEEKP
jgi:hypothetical protein